MCWISNIFSSLFKNPGEILFKIWVVFPHKLSRHLPNYGVIMTVIWICTQRCYGDECITHVYFYPGCGSVDHQVVSQWTCQAKNEHLHYRNVLSVLDASDNTLDSGLLEIVQEQEGSMWQNAHMFPVVTIFLPSTNTIKHTFPVWFLRAMILRW